MLISILLRNIDGICIRIVIIVCGNVYIFSPKQSVNEQQQRKTDYCCLLLN